jgi:hypothetical protein
MSRFREYCPPVFYIHDTLYVIKYLNHERKKFEGFLLREETKKDITQVLQAICYVLALDSIFG